MHMNQLCLFLLSLFSASPYFRPSPHQTSSPNSRPVHLLDSNICDKLTELFFLFFFVCQSGFERGRADGFSSEKGSKQEDRSNRKERNERATEGREVGGCMWVPARLETGSVRERGREGLCIGVCGYETRRIITQCVDAA